MTIDGDLQNDPADIATLLPHIKTFDLVCGWRKTADNLTKDFVPYCQQRPQRRHRRSRPRHRLLTEAVSAGCGGKNAALRGHASFFPRWP